MTEPPPSQHAAFLEALAVELARYPADARGPGLLHRLGRDLQRTFLRRPPAVCRKGLGKYGRPDALRR
jgi:hypothetical protein